MMDMPGWQICNKIKHSEFFAGTRVIGISGIFTDQEDIDKFSADTDLYFTKPLDLDILNHAIQRITQ